MLPLCLKHHGRPVQVLLHDHLPRRQAFRVFVPHGGEGRAQLSAYRAASRSGGLMWTDERVGDEVTSVELRCDRSGFNVGGVTLPWTVLNHSVALEARPLHPCMRCDRLTGSPERLCDAYRSETGITSRAATEAWEDCVHCAYTHDFLSGDTRVAAQESRW